MDCYPLDSANAITANVSSRQSRAFKSSRRSQSYDTSFFRFGINWVYRSERLAGQPWKHLLYLADQVIAVEALQIGEVGLVPSLISPCALLQLFFLLAGSNVENLQLCIPVWIEEVGH
jgi:hypothetical protein